MMVVDTSALLAVLECEPDTPAFARTISEADPPLISAALLVEAGIVMLNRHGAKGLRMLKQLIQAGGFQVESVPLQQAEQALEAYAVYGKGQKSEAGLNYGDCFFYALAKVTGLPLLFKVQDFRKTDLTPVL